MNTMNVGQLKVWPSTYSFWFSINSLNWHSRSHKSTLQDFQQPHTISGLHWHNSSLTNQPWRICFNLRLEPTQQQGPLCWILPGLGSYSILFASIMFHSILFLSWQPLPVFHLYPFMVTIPILYSISDYIYIFLILLMDYSQSLPRTWLRVSPIFTFIYYLSIYFHSFITVSYLQ